MERRHKFTRFHLVMIIAVLIGIITVAWAVISIKNIKDREAESKKVVQVPVEEEIVESTSEPLPDDVEEPDYTLDEFENQKVLVEINSDNRYNIDDMSKIINKYVKAKDEEGNTIELNLSYDNDLSVAGVDSSMYDECMSVWQPIEGYAIVIAKESSDSAGELTLKLRTYYDNMAKSASSNKARENFNYYKTFGYGEYIVYLACDNCIDLGEALKSYMSNTDQQAVKDFEDKYEVNEYGAYLKEDDSEEASDAVEENVISGASEGQSIESSDDATDSVSEIIENNTTQESN